MDLDIYSLFIVTSFDKFQCINFVVSKHVKIKFVIVVNFYGHMFRNPLEKIKSDFVLALRHISIPILNQIRIQLVGKFRSSKNLIQIFWERLFSSDCRKKWKVIKKRSDAKLSDNFREWRAWFTYVPTSKGREQNGHWVYWAA